MMKIRSYWLALGLTAFAALPVCAQQQAPAQGTSATPPAPAAVSGDANAGREKTAMCQGCHEIPGWHTAFPETYRVPRIIGQHPGYIVSALQAYKSGARQHPSMRAIAASLSDKDMADLAAYYGAQGVQTATK